MIVYTQDCEGYKTSYITDKLTLLKDGEIADMIVFICNGEEINIPVEDLCYIEN